MAPLVKLLGAKADIVYTGQHYDEAMAGVFFDAFSIPRPSTVVDVGNLSRGEQLGVGTSALTRLFSDTRPEAVVVHGDTNSALAGALAANSVQVPLVHVEAGLRSFDRAMPEEHNRVLVDHLSDLLLAPTSTSMENLTSECCAGVIEVTGNTVVEAVNAMLPDHDTCRHLLESYGLGDNGFVLATIHRPENTDNPDRLRAIFTSLQSLDIPVLVPLHPRTASRLRSLDMTDLLHGLQVIEPIGYSAFLGLASRARLLISDSGGVQEEASVLKRPAVVVRRSTERPEVMGTFATLSRPEELTTVAQEWLQDAVRRQGLLADLPSPYGAGDAGRLSVKAIEELIG